jgi:hypothetical protein
MRASEQIFRCYPAPAKKKKSGSETPAKTGFIEPEFQASSEVAAEINRIGFPWAGPMLIFDCETLTGAKDGQGLRFGCFQERGWRYDWRVANADAKTPHPRKTRHTLARWNFVRTKKLHAGGNQSTETICQK